MTLAMPELLKEYGCFIGGEWRPAKDGATFETHCPADGRLLASCAEATREDVDDAVKAAWKAWESWKNVAPAERAAILMKVADAIDAHKEHLAMVESLDNGKPIRETLNVDVPMSADHFRYFAGAVRTEEGSAAMLDGNTLSLILREPIGVVGQVLPALAGGQGGVGQDQQQAHGRRREQAYPSFHGSFPPLYPQNFTPEPSGLSKAIPTSAGRFSRNLPPFWQGRGRAKGRRFRSGPIVFPESQPLTDGAPG